RERRWVLFMLGVAVAARLLTIAVIFLLTDHQRQAYATLFGDENHTKLTSVWLRDAVLGLPMESLNVWAAYNQYGRSGYYYAVALLQFFVGPSPYGVHLLNIALHLTGCVALHRVLRAAYGRGAAMCAFIALLFWPTLFVWS